MHKYLLLAGIACLGWESSAHAQPRLGSPIPQGSPVEGTVPAQPCDLKADCYRPRLIQPGFGGYARSLLFPARTIHTDRVQPIVVSDVPTREDIARMIVDGGYSPAEVTAAKIKIDEAQAHARQAAVRFLGTVDCNYYPEAESGLIAALRADRAETVRYEAAVALANCRLLTDKMLDALNLTALGGDLDGNPAETSERVRSAARQTLHRCASRGLCLPPLAVQPLAPVAMWLPPEQHLLQSTYIAPLPNSPPVTPKDRELAQTVSAKVQAENASPQPRSLYHYLIRYAPFRGASSSARNKVDPRLQGLTPIGSESMLAIPTTPPPPAHPLPLPSYNDNR